MNLEQKLKQQLGELMFACTVLATELEQVKLELEEFKAKRKEKNK